MANRYWRGGSGTWSSSNTANWSTTSGGAGGASVPTSADVAIFNASSGGGVVTINDDRPCLNFNTTGYTGRLDCSGGGYISHYNGSNTVDSTNASGTYLNIYNRATGTSGYSFTVSASGVVINDYQKVGSNTSTSNNITGSAPYTVNNITTNTAGGISFISSSGGVTASGTWTIAGAFTTGGGGAFITHNGTVTFSSTMPALPTITSASHFNNINLAKSGDINDQWYVQNLNITAGTITCATSSPSYLGSLTVSAGTFYNDNDLLNLSSVAVAGGTFGIRGNCYNIGTFYLTSGTLSVSSAVTLSCGTVNVTGGSFTTANNANLYCDLYFHGGGSMSFSNAGICNFYGTSFSVVDGSTLSWSGTTTPQFYVGANNTTFSTDTNVSYAGYLQINSSGVNIVTFQSPNASSLTFSRLYNNMVGGIIVVKNIILTFTTINAWAATARYRCLMFGTYGYTNTLTVTAYTVKPSYTDFYNISTGSNPTGSTALGDCGLNTGITFSSPVTRYWKGGSSLYWDDTANWSSTSGGATGATAPLVQDTAIFDSNTTAGIYINDRAPAKIQATAGTSYTISSGGTKWVPIFFKDYDAPDMVWLSGNFIMGPTSGTTATIKTNPSNTSQLMVVNASTLLTNSAQASWQLGSTLNLYAGTLYLDGPVTFNTNSYNINCSGVSFSSSSATGSFGTSTISTASVGGGYDAAFTLSGVTWNPYRTTGSGSTSTTFYLYHSPAKFLITDGTAATANIYMNSSYTIGEIVSTRTSSFTISSLIGVKTNKWTVSGSSGNLIAVLGDYTYTGTGVVSADYLYVQGSHVTPATLTWYAGNNSTNAGGNTGWIFSAPGGTGGNGLFFGSNF